MFLKKESFTYNAEQIQLHELSALQRAEYFEFLASKDTGADGEQPNVAQTAALVRLNTEVNAWLVSRSLWHDDRDRDVEMIFREVQATWPDKALALAVDKVLVLSDMKGPEPGEQEEVDNDNAPAESLEKS
ncbi:phage tail assembly chaperone G [Serratia liquefaciens]|uniref:phage tail assembly chaperone G n=1 Tax=Serratia liquefaciens TaxID=614 RepID=UPI0022B99516|nr:phage minor tail protein G [Serratia liquefaciens]